MSFFKSLVGSGMLPIVQATQASTNSPTASSAPKVSGNKCNNAFCRPLLDSIKTGNEHDMLAKFLRIKPMVFLGSESENVYIFILEFYERL